MSKEGFGTIFGLAVFAAFLGFLSSRFDSTALIVLFIVNIILIGFCIYFFRDPKRIPPDDPFAIISPADGKVVEIAKVIEHEYIEGEATRISIFLSVFNVHVNYVPFAGIVDYVRYNKGTFHPAFRDKASDLNEHTFIGINTKFGKLVFKQIAGVLARRIICNLRQDDTVKTAQKCGIIKFGSRVDVFLPDWATLSVNVGDKLSAGKSVIGKVNEK